MILAIDCGNTRLKWGVHDGAHWLAQGLLDYAELPALAGLLAALGAAAPTPSGSASSRRYLECVQGAGDDIAKLQACARYAP